MFRRLAQALLRPVLGTLPGRVFLVAAVGKLVLTAVGTEDAGAAGRDVLSFLNGATTVALALPLGYLLFRLLGRLQRLLLWRVRRRLIVSYVFIGFVPVLLIVAFFLIAGALMLLTVSSYLVTNGLNDVVDEAAVLAQGAVIEIRRARGPQGAEPAENDARAILERRLEAVASRHPEASLALVPRASPQAGARSSQPAPIIAGPWRHVDPPPEAPAWIGDEGFGGVVAFTSGGTGSGLVARAVSVPDDRAPAYALVVDLPVEAMVVDRVREATGIEVVNPTLLAGGTGGGTGAPQLTVTVDDQVGRAGGGVTWVSILEYTDWPTGTTRTVNIETRVHLGDFYDRILSTQMLLGGTNLFLLALAVFGGLFLVIESVALVMGFALAKSITGSVHALFMGTQRVRQGDFTHRIAVRTRDQLGMLAESFNSMTSSVEGLLQEAAEKKRLEEELRIAREIQMSLLPTAPVTTPGLAVTALSVPAREVGGDYYDFVQLGARRLAILVADVSGKGTSAAFYMAELKGLVLSLSRIYQSPKQLLIEVNRIISANLDPRSFITMTYGVLDLEAGTFTYARAGHTPLMYVPAGRPGQREAQVLTPDGLVLGLQFEGIEKKFADLLEECSLPVAGGDLLVLFTDGITEAMNESGDFFGESRLSRLIEEHGHLPSEELRERIVRDVEAFVGPADQHDDMTMVVLKIEDGEIVAQGT